MSDQQSAVSGQQSAISGQRSAGSRPPRYIVVGQARREYTVVDRETKRPGRDRSLVAVVYPQPDVDAKALAEHLAAVLNSYGSGVVA